MAELGGASEAEVGGRAVCGLPPTMHINLERTAELRYGENPHQG